MTGNPLIFIAWGGRRRTSLHASGRTWQILDLFALFGCPIATNPAIAVSDLLPITRHPRAAWWDTPPEATDPNKVAALIVKMPVTWYPHDVFPIRFLIGR
jgi:hypothetical protein